MSYIVTIDKFEGPLDLLLHLIKDTNLDIHEVNLEQITKQYLEYINKMEELNLSVASEYLIMAAELIEIKSSSLLPSKKLEEQDEDLKENLINRLIEYKQYKEKLEDFKNLENERNKQFSKLPSDLTKYKDINVEEEKYDLDLLINAWNEFLKRKELDKPLNTKITNKEYSVSKRSNEILKQLKIKNRISFDELFQILNKEYVVVTFLAMLNLAKKNNIKIIQENNFEKIFLESSDINE